MKMQSHSSWCKHVSDFAPATGFSVLERRGIMTSHHTLWFPSSVWRQQMLNIQGIINILLKRNRHNRHTPTDPTWKDWPQAAFPKLGIKSMAESRKNNWNLDIFLNSGKDQSSLITLLLLFHNQSPQFSLGSWF